MKKKVRIGRPVPVEGDNETIEIRDVEEIELLCRKIVQVFVLSPEQRKAADLWQKEHGCGEARYPGRAVAWGSSQSLIFTGCFVEVRCDECGAILDLGLITTIDPEEESDDSGKPLDLTNLNLYEVAESIAKMMYKGMYEPSNIFAINEEEAKSAEEWQSRHECNPASVNNTGVTQSFIFKQGSLGDNVEVKCNKCNAVADVTDYDAF